MTSAARTTHTDVVTDPAELRAIVGPVGERAANKVRTTVGSLHRQWIAACPFVVVATFSAEGGVDASPKGDPPGFVHVLDDTTLVLPERPGNRRLDGFLNVLANPRVGLLFVIPGRGDTLRINGRARIVRDAPWFDDLVVKGHRPMLALEVSVEEVFFHCGKAFLRSDMWKPETWHPDAVPSRAVIAQQIERPDQSLEELERYYGEQYQQYLY